MNTTNDDKNVHDKPGYKRRGCLGWGLRLISVLFTLLLVLFLAAFTVEKITLAQLPEKYPPPGEMVDVGPYSLHLYCTGDPSARPVVVVSTGAGGSVADWALVQPGVAEFARICIYDRLGLGWSFGAPLGQTYQEEAEDVHTLLNNAGIVEPYILVGASYGGAVMQVYASMYPDDAAGLVMVDAVTREIESKYPEKYQENLKISRRITSAFSTPGLFRLMQWFGLLPKTTPLFENLPADWKEIANSLVYNSRMGADRKATMSNFDVRNAEFMSAAPLPDVPVIVIARDLADMLPGPPLDEETILQAEKVWRDAQIELAAQVSDGTLIVAEGSGHSIQHEKPGVVIDAIREIVEKVRDE